MNERFRKCCGEVITLLVARASDVAKLLSQPPAGDEVSMKFGKIFEEEYTLANHIYMRTGYTQVPRWFARKVAARLRLEGIYSRELVVKAYRAYATLLKAGIVGVKPPTHFRMFSDSLLIGAQPDLYDESTGTYYEFKLYPINEYARAQATVFAWVLRRPVVLAGLKEDSREYMEVEKDVISPPDDLKVDLEDLRRIAISEDFCTDPMIPLHRYVRYHSECGES
ncbi:MAG: hypothetical protein QW705_00085 [Zestosphaera sp.]